LSLPYPTCVFVQRDGSRRILAQPPPPFPRPSTGFPRGAWLPAFTLALGNPGRGDRTDRSSRTVWTATLAARSQVERGNALGSEVVLRVPGAREQRLAFAAGEGAAWRAVLGKPARDCGTKYSFAFRDGERGLR